MSRRCRSRAPSAAHPPSSGTSPGRGGWGGVVIVVVEAFVFIEIVIEIFVQVIVEGVEFLIVEAILEI